MGCYANPAIYLFAHMRQKPTRNGYRRCHTNPRSAGQSGLAPQSLCDLQNVVGLNADWYERLCGKTPKHLAIRERFQMGVVKRQGDQPDGKSDHTCSATRVDG